MMSPRCYHNRCVTARTPLSDNKKRNHRQKKLQLLAWRKKLAGVYTLPTFSTQLKSNVNSEQLSILNYFEQYPLVQEKADFNKENTPYSVIYLKQSHFENGTLRLTHPGIYVLSENITFEPNKNDDFFPTMAQIQSGEYPMGTSGPYHLGFFAAITIEADNILLDLNKKTIKQSPLHNLQQRFYANIELASSPFIPAQGPGNFGDSIVTPTNVLIMNGHLGLSSHHGIHGNGMSKVCLKDLTIGEMEVAAIALNGAVQSILDNINVLGTFTQIPTISTYSQGRFARQFLNILKTRTPGANLMVKSQSKTIDTIINELNAELDSTRDSVLNDGNIPSNIFGNPSQLYDGNVYGIVLNVRGVVIGDFIKERPAEALGNTDIHLQNITIDNTVSQPLEILAVNSTPTDGEAYGGKRQVGPAGDVLKMTLVTANDGTYEPNTLANAQMILAKYNDPKNGTTNIEMPMVNWAQNNTDISNVMVANDYYYVGGGDSMGHAMKGNIGLFVSAGQNIMMKNITINNVDSRGSDVGTSPLIADASQNKQGAMATGILITGTTNAFMGDVTINKVVSTNGDANGVYILSSSNIGNSNLSISNISTNSSTNNATPFKQE